MKLLFKKKSTEKLVENVKGFKTCVQEVPGVVIMKYKEPGSGLLSSFLKTGFCKIS